MNIQEFKEKYPAYKNVDDDKLANALHQKFYKDKMSLSQFRQRVGLSPEVISQNEEPGYWQQFKNWASEQWDELTGKPEPGIGPITQKDLAAFTSAALGQQSPRSSKKGKTKTFSAKKQQTSEIQPSQSVQATAQNPPISEQRQIAERTKKRDSSLKIPFLLKPGAAEAGIAFAQSMAALPISGIVGPIWSALDPDTSATEAIHKTQKAIIQKPKTKAGKKTLTLINYPFRKLYDFSQWAGNKAMNKVLEETNNENLATLAGTATATSILAAPMLLGFARKAPKAFEKIKQSTPWREMTIKERSLAVQSLDDMMRKNPNMTEGEILRKWNNPNWRKQALERRITGERPTRAETKTAPTEPPAESEAASEMALPSVRQSGGAPEPTETSPVVKPTKFPQKKAIPVPPEEQPAGTKPIQDELTPPETPNLTEQNIKAINNIIESAEDPTKDFFEIKGEIQEQAATGEFTPEIAQAVDNALDNQLDSVEETGNIDRNQFFRDVETELFKYTTDTSATIQDELAQQEQTIFENEVAPTQEEPINEEEKQRLELENKLRKESDLELYNKTVGRIRKFGGLNYQDVKNEYGKGTIETLQSKFGFDFVKNKGEPLDTATEILTEEYPELNLQHEKDNLIELLENTVKSKKQINKQTTYQQLPTETQTLTEDHTLNLDMPELVRLAKEVLGGKYPKIKRSLRKRGAIGKANFRGPEANIDLRYDIYKNPFLAKKTLAHEIGHVIDWLPEKEISRGNILGRIASLKKYMKDSIDATPTDPSQILTPKERNMLHREARKEAVSQGLSGEELKRVTKNIYQRKLKEEMAVRDLVTRDEIMDELKELTKTWTPFNPEADPKYTAYRYQPKELYAEAISILLNDPELLRFEAPKFWDTFWNYAERKPEVMQIYNQIQDEINGVSSQGAHYQSRKNLRDGFRKYDRLYARKVENVPLKERIAQEFIDVASAIIRRGKKLNERNIPAEKNPRYYIDQLRHSGSEFELYMNEALQAQKILKEAGLTNEDLGEYMTHLRIIHERKRYEPEEEQYVEIANPEGFDPKSSRAVLDEWLETLGEDKARALEQARKKFYENHRRIVQKMRDSELFSPDLMDKIENAEYYARFDVGKYLEDRYGLGTGAAIQKQYGTHQQISNPVTATIIKDLSMIKAVNRHIAARKVAEFMQEYYPDEIEVPEKKYNADKGFAVPVEPRDPNMAQIKYLQNGKLQAYNVPKEIAKSVESNPVESNLISDILRQTAKPFRHLFVEANPGFWMFNAIRDTMRPSKNIPDLSLTKFIPEYIKALKPAFQSTFGVPPDVIRQMQLGNMLISLENYRGWEVSEDAVLESQLKKWSNSQNKWYQQVIKPVANAYNYWTNIGKALERSPKVATYQWLKKKYPDLSDRVIGHIVRNHGGSPDFLRKGKQYNLYNNLLFFSNAIKEGWRSDIEAARGQLGEKMGKGKKQSAAGWWWKHAKYSLIPKFFMYAASLGLLGEGMRRLMDGATEYDKTNYTVIPIGSTPQGKSVYFRLPNDETGRVLGGILWKAMQDNKGNDFQNLYDYMAGQAPTLHPIFKVIWDTTAYMSGKNPYDWFRDRPAIPEQVFKAHDWDTHKAFLEYMADQTGLSIVHDFNYDDLNQVKGELEKAVDYPISSNTLGRFLKVTDYGIQENIEKELKPLETKQARELKRARKAVIKMLNGEKLNQDDMQAMLKHPRSVDRNFSTLLARKYGSTWQHAFLSASSKEEQAKILQLFLKKHPELVQENG